MSYYGADQSQVQRELSTKSLDDTRKSLLFNGFVRFPLTFFYVIMGLALGAAHTMSYELQSEVPVAKIDFLVPVFILQAMPDGIRGILVSALLAGAMSSLDSALNSLSASTMRDFVEKKQDLSEKQILVLSKVTTVIWGTIITGFAFVVGNISDTVIESINKIGSAFYGPILASFLIGVLSQSATATGILVGVLSGVGFNLILWIGYPEVFWMWWNLFGVAIAFTVTFLVSLVTSARPKNEILPYTLSGSHFYKYERLWHRGYTALLVYFFLLLAFMLFLNYFAPSIIGSVDT